METRRIEVIKPIIEDETTNQINFGCSTIYGGPVITETQLEFAKISLISANIKKIKKLFFNVLTTISCQLKALDRSFKAPKEENCSLSQRVYGIFKYSVKSQKENQNLIKNYEHSVSKPKKNMSDSLESYFSVHWPSFEWKWGLWLTKPRNERWIIS